jgi:hypothetical protein
LTKAAGIALGLALLGGTAAPAALAQNEGMPLSGAPSASEIEALVDGILAEVFGETAVPDDSAIDDTTSGGDLNVGGSMGGTVTMGGGMGGDISIGGGSGGSGSVSGG